MTNGPCVKLIDRRPSAVYMRSAEITNNGCNIPSPKIDNSAAFVLSRNYNTVNVCSGISITYIRRHHHVTFAPSVLVVVS